MSRAVDLLTIWESACGLPPLARARTLAHLARPDRQAPPPVGAAHADLFALRRALFGSKLVALATCPHCDARLESEMNVEDFLATQGEEARALHEIQTDTGAIKFRLPTLDDLAALRADLPPHEAAEALFDACLIEAEKAPEPSGREKALALMAQLDPLADPSITMRCEECATEFDCAFDICQFLWREIEAATARLFGEVHVLARHYGWGEVEILAMSAPRRQVYLDLIAA